MAEKDRHILAREQRIGALLLFILALAGWLYIAIRQSKHPDTTPPDKPAKKSWAERKDSIRLADSMRYVQWKIEREARYDSVKKAMAIRHEAYKAELQQWFDSTRRADSVWRDSLGIKLPKKEKKDTLLDLNHCDTAELQLIRGIGRFTALKIIEYRKQLGGFYSPEQLLDKQFLTRVRQNRFPMDSLLSHFTADTADVRPLRVNSCSVDALARHPYLRYEQAKAIYTLRRKHARLQSIDDLRSLPELPDSALTRLAPYLSFD